MTTRLKHYDAIVIGSGLSGLLAATRLVERGARVYVIGKGGGFLHFTSGCVDVLGTTLDGDEVEDPSTSVAEQARRKPSHPYAVAGASLEEGVRLFRTVTEEAGYPFHGELNRVMRLPTAIGAVRPTCLVPISMAAGDVDHQADMLVVGFHRFRDFYPPYLVANLQTTASFAVHHLYLDPPEFQGRHHLSSLDVARYFDEPAFRERVAREVRKSLRGAGRVGFPAVLGIECAREAHAHLQQIIEVPVFEISTLPPSVPGIRLQNIFRRRLARSGARFEMGFWVTGRVDADRVAQVHVESPANATIYSADAWILATGGVGGGGITTGPDSSLRETVFGLPVDGPPNRRDWFRDKFLGPEPQPISMAGIRTDDRLRPKGDGGTTVENLFVTASNLPNWDPTRERSGEGVAIATGYRAAEEAMVALGGRREPSNQPLSPVTS